MKKKESRPAKKSAGSKAVENLRPRATKVKTAENVRGGFKGRKAGGEQIEYLKYSS